MTTAAPTAPSYTSACATTTMAYNTFTDAHRTEDFLEFIDPDALPVVRARIQQRHFKKGDVIFKTGDMPDGIYRIESGKVKVFRSADERDDSAQNVLGIYGDGIIFGALSVCDPGPRNATAVAQTDCDLRFIAQDDAEFLFQTEPTFTRAILLSTARHLRLAQNATSAMVLQDVTGRVARAIVLLATRFGKQQPDGTILVRHDITQADIAAMVGSSREAVNKALGEFTNRGWIWSTTRRLVVRSYDRLVRRAGQYEWDQTPITPATPETSDSPATAS